MGTNVLKVIHATLNANETWFSMGWGCEYRSRNGVGRRMENAYWLIIRRVQTYQAEKLEERFLFLNRYHPCERISVWEKSNSERERQILSRRRPISGKCSRWINYKSGWVKKITDNIQKLWFLCSSRFAHRLHYAIHYSVNLMTNFKALNYSVKMRIYWP